jgi:hypothetical protein
MEGLNLNDLSFDTDDNDIFDVFAVDQKKPAGEPEKDIKIKTPISEDEVTKKTENPENVAKTEDDKTNQDGKAPKADNEGDDSSSPTPNDTEKLYSSLAAEFKAKGILSTLDLDKDKISSIDDINKAIQKEVESRLSSKNKTIEEAIKAGVPAGEAEQHIASIEKLKAISEDYISHSDNEDFRRNVIAQDFINRGFAKDKSIAMAQRSIDSGDDIEDAVNAMKEIVASEEGKLNGLISTKQADEKSALENIKNFVDKEEEIIPGVKLTSAQKEELYSQITTDLGNKENAFVQAQKKDPLGSRMKLEAMFYLTKGLTDFSVFGNAKESSISKGIESLLRGANFTGDGKIITDSKDSISTFSLKDLDGAQFE